MAYAGQTICAGMTLQIVRALCEEKMLQLGAESFWYYDVGAFVFCGDETSISVSGINYHTSDRLIAKNDIITIDLSPQADNIWGDYARTLIVQNGVVVDESTCTNEEWKKGVVEERILHEIMTEFVTPDTTFEELYMYMNTIIQRHGFVNLDFLGNLGHSVVRRKEDRKYIENGNRAYLSEVEFFTFEPHISLPGSKYGFKREDIYYFENGSILQL